MARPAWTAQCTNRKLIGELLPVRRRESHKGDYGRVLLLCGSEGLTGAARLAAKAALRTGSGLVYLGVPEKIYPIIAAGAGSEIVFPLPCDEAGRLCMAALPAITARLPEMDAVLLGPGLGRSDGTAALTAALIRKFPGKIVLDADALWAVSLVPDILREAKSEIVITPHEGEFLRLGGSLENGRERGAWEFARRYGCVTVLKGHRTIIAHPAERMYVIEAGNPGMAKGGSGDVLTGVTAALLGQMETERAAVTACAVHAGAGDVCAQKLGEYGMTPSDIIEELPYIFKTITE